MQWRIGLLILAAATLPVACGKPQPRGKSAAPAVIAAAQKPAPDDAHIELVDPPAPGTPGGLPDDRTPVSEAPFTETSAQGAANVVQTYYALIGEKAYARAWALWSDDGKASGQPTAQAFAQTFDRFSQYNAQIGAPGTPEGAAGSSYVTVPVVIYGRLKTGAEVHEKGQAVLRRVNDVPGSTAEQRRWHISRIDTAAAN
jgi:ketosteroid isomerase-like protein